MSGVLRGEKELRALADAAMKASTADETEVFLTARTNALTRYANAYIHQNVVSTEAGVRVRAVKGKRVALISTDRSIAKVSRRPRATRASSLRSCRRTRASPGSSSRNRSRARRRRTTSELPRRRRWTARKR